MGKRKKRSENEIHGAIGKPELPMVTDMNKTDGLKTDNDGGTMSDRHRKVGDLGRAHRGQFRVSFTQSI